MDKFDPFREDLTPYGFGCKRWAPAVMRRPDRHNEIELNFLTQGWLTYLFGGKFVKISANRLTAFWAAVPHQIVDHGGQTDYFVVTIPLRWFLTLRLSEPIVQSLMHGEMVSSAPVESPLLLQGRLAEWERDFTSLDTSTHTAAYLEIEAMLRRFSLDSRHSATISHPSPKRGAIIHDGALAKAEQIAQAVADLFAEPVNAADLVQRIDANPKRAMRIFRMVFGTSVSTFLTEYRIAQAKRLLVTTNLRIVDISEASGFGSLGRFNRAFLHACDCPPREYRKRHAMPGQD